MIVVVDVIMLWPVVTRESGRGQRELRELSSRADWYYYHHHFPELRIQSPKSPVPGRTTVSLAKSTVRKKETSVCRVLVLSSQLKRIRLHTCLKTNITFHLGALSSLLCLWREIPDRVLENVDAKEIYEPLNEMSGDWLPLLDCLHARLDGGFEDSGLEGDTGWFFDSLNWIFWKVTDKVFWLNFSHVHLIEISYSIWQRSFDIFTTASLQTE